MAQSSRPSLASIASAYVSVDLNVCRAVGHAHFRHAVQRRHRPKAEQAGVNPVTRREHVDVKGRKI